MSMLDIRTGFQKALEENEDDALTRSVYADWLEEHGDRIEAERQRQWPTAKKWMVEFCEALNAGRSSAWDDEPISYHRIMQLCRGVAGGWSGNCGNDQGLSDAMNDNSEELLRNWAILTGLNVSNETPWFACSC